jgi:alanine-glyoxylate transaminase/serine-glyoxylate transaminase/serine-pyruvate transaminase
MGLSMVVPQPERLPMLNAVSIPDGVEDKPVRDLLLKDFGLEIGGGLGEFAGKVWRVGIMGHACRKTNVFQFLTGLKIALQKQGCSVGAGALEAAEAVYGEG